MTKTDQATLNTVHQVLKPLVVTLAALARVDLGKFSSMLADASAHADDKLAAHMLNDLAQGLAMLASAGNPKQ